jgi:ABC-type glutathione transport system ATPase component
MILASGLSFLGLGVKPPEPEWGLMLNTLRTAIYVHPWIAALPGADDLRHLHRLQPACRQRALRHGHPSMNSATHTPSPVQDRGGPAQPLLVVRDLTKHFAGARRPLRTDEEVVHAVDGVSFSVPKGKTLGIVGESGCGKSTTARLIARLMQADSGSMVFDGEGVDEFGGIRLKEFRRSLQMVFQDSMPPSTRG